MGFGIKILGFLALLIIYHLSFITVYAVYDPVSVPNNKFGIHIISATDHEASPAAALVNSSGGDWGYITVLAESKDRDVNKWQAFFNDLRRRHLIPIIRLATQPEKSFWKRPYEGEEEAWASFLDNLTWPVKNRYVIIYNEPNQAKEWGNQVDPEGYAKVLDKTITALKSKSNDFFVLNAGFDASAPYKPPDFFDESQFLQKMEEAVPGIFERLDGWSSHSYPNPGFTGSPNGFGKGSVRTWQWELQKLAELGVKKKLPVFITETGWQHAEGLVYDKSLPSAENVANFYKQAMGNAWNNNTVVAVTPFLLNYQEIPFDHFSFKKITGERQSKKILGVEFPDYYPQYTRIKDLPKTQGLPVQENKAELVKGEIYSSIVSDQWYEIPLTFKNSGQSIWNEYDQVKLVPDEEGLKLGIREVLLPEDQKIEPGQDYSFKVNLKAPQYGFFKVKLILYRNDIPFDSKPLEFTTEVKQPVILKIHSTLDWKKNFEGSYILKTVGALGKTFKNIILSKDGLSPEMEAAFLIPDYTFDFTLEKPFYKPKTIRRKVFSGVNTLDFGSLQPDIPSAILHPKQLWKLLPFSN